MYISTMFISSTGDSCHINLCPMAASATSRKAFSWAWIHWFHQLLKNEHPNGSMNILNLGCWNLIVMLKSPLGCFLLIGFIGISQWKSYLESVSIFSGMFLWAVWKILSHQPYHMMWANQMHESCSVIVRTWKSNMPSSGHLIYQTYQLKSTRIGASWTMFSPFWDASTCRENLTGFRDYDLAKL